MGHTTLGIDISALRISHDNRIFFILLTKYWPGKVIIISPCGEVDMITKWAKERQYRYDDVVDASNNELSDIIKKYKINYYFGADDDILNTLPWGITAFKTWTSPHIIEQEKQAEKWLMDNFFRLMSNDYYEQRNFNPNSVWCDHPPQQ